jgi:hypothetical protein
MRMAVTRVVDQSRNEHREVSIHLEWRRIPSNPHLFPPEWQITDPWNAPSRNDGQLRRPKRCTGVISRTSCHRLASTSAYPDVAKVRRSTPDSIALVRLGRNHHERDCKRAQGRNAKAQFWSFPASAGKRIQSEAQGAGESLLPWYLPVPGKAVLKLSWIYAFPAVSTVVETRGR